LGIAVTKLGLGITEVGFQDFGKILREAGWLGRRSYSNKTLGRKKGDEQLFEGLQLSFEPLDTGG
jgi:hypothetical protein